MIWEHVHTVKKVLHNPFDDMGDSMTIGGKVGECRKTTDWSVVERGSLVM